MTNETIKTMLLRYSCRAYTDKTPSDEDLRTIANAAVAAPSAMNLQRWHVIVVKNKELIQDMEAEGMRIIANMEDKSTYERIMSRGGKLYYNAPCMIVIAVPKSENPGSELLDCGIVTQNIALAATSLGIDNVICGMTRLCLSEERADELKQRLGFPEGYDFGMSVLLGYAQEPGKPHEPDMGKVSFVE